MKLAHTFIPLIALVAFGASALAKENSLVVFQKAAYGRPGVADALESSTLVGSTVTITTRLGVVVPVKFYSKLNATILDAYLKSGYSVDVSDCAELDRPIANSTAYEGECTRRTYTVRFRCGLFDTARTFHGARAADYVMQNVVSNPLEETRTTCHSSGNKF